MRQIMEHLRALQTLELNTRRLTLEQKAEILKRREQVPAPILSHFDRLIARGRVAVTTARGGVCSGCHLQVTRGTLMELTHPVALPKCDNCGRFLYLPENEFAAAGLPPAGKSGKARMTHAG